MHLTLVPWIASAGELKTKPTQHSVKELLGLGIQPDILLCRCERPIPAAPARRSRCSAICAKARSSRRSMSTRSMQVPVAYHAEGFDREVCAISASRRRSPTSGAGGASSSRIRQPEGEVTIAIVGKYTACSTATNRLAEAMTHGGIANNVRVKLDWIDSEVFEPRRTRCAWLEGVHGILVPGGFGERGSEGKIDAARFARERKVPYFGICFGMQMAVIEAARHLAWLCRAAARPSSARASTRWSG